MKTTFNYSLLLFLFLATSLKGQECERPTASQTIQPNLLQTVINNTGSFINASGNEIGFENIMVRPGASALYATSIWLGAQDATGNLKLSAETYNSNDLVSFIPGPYPVNGNLNSTTCANYDRFFRVTRDQIELHRADYADNQIINNPIDAIFGWPATGNQEFENVNGFELPNLFSDFAPFHDQNNDGIYNPNDGDFPLPNAANENNVPDEILWCVFNDAPSDLSLGVEIQMTVWGFYCTDNDLLNSTLFTSHKIINKSPTTLENMRLGVWADFDLGCPFDDYVGCEPSQNSFYVYNSFFNDQCSCSPYTPFCGAESTLSVTMLNQELSSFINILSSNEPNPPGMLDPSTAPEYYNFLNGQWGDGTPLTEGGSGYNVAGGTPTAFAFPDSPNDVNGWSMLSEGLGGRDQRGLGNLNIGSFAPGEIYTLDLAYSFHHLEGGNSFEQITPMISNIAQIKGIYNNQFLTTCTPLALCEEDCVWPGDANADGIANYDDLLEIGLAFSSEGPIRIGPTNWRAFEVDNWTNNFIDNTNFKHADCNGDGVVDEIDFQDVTLPFYGFTNDKYQPVSICNEGPQLSLTQVNGDPVDTIPGSNLFAVVNVDYDEMLYGLSFQVEFDTNYFSRILTIPINVWDGENSNESIRFARPSSETIQKNIVEYATTKLDGLNSPLSGGVVVLDMKGNQNLSLSLPPVTQIKFKNVRAILNDGTPVEFGGTTTDIVLEVLTGTNNFSNQLPIELSPNPASDHIQINFNGFKAKQIELFDTKGRLIKSIAAHGQT